MLLRCAPKNGMIHIMKPNSAVLANGWACFRKQIQMMEKRDRSSHMTAKTTYTIYCTIFLLQSSSACIFGLPVELVVLGVLALPAQNQRKQQTVLKKS